MTTKTEISTLEDHTGYWLRRVSNHVSQAFASKLAAKDTSVAEWVLLRMLYGHESCTPSHIAVQMGMTKGAITKLVDRLISQSLVTRNASADDGRVQNISLTPQGKRLVPVLAALADENDKECFSMLTEKDQKALKRILNTLSTHLGVTTTPTK